MTRPRQALFLLFVGLAALALSACGDDDPASAAGDGDQALAADDEPGAEPAEPDDATEPASASDPAGSEPGDAAPEPEGAEPEPAPAEPEPPSYDFSAVSPIVEDFVEENDLNGAGLIVVHRDDGVVYHEHWGEFDEDRISLIASSSKMITAGVLLRLDDDGLLDLDAPVADVVDWGSANPDVTPAQLISNSSGLVGLLPDPAYPPYICQYLAVGTLQSCGEAIFTTADDDAEIVPPDTEFRYGGAQWQVAAAVAEAASGRSWAELIDETYVQPCELETLAFNNHFTQLGPGGFEYPTDFDGDPSILAPTDNPNAEGGAYVTTGDYGKLLLMHLRDGMCPNGQVLSPEALDRMHSDRIGATYEGDAWDPDTGYGMGWWIDRERGYISDGGAYGTVPWLDLDDGYGAFLVIEADSPTGNLLAEQLYDVVESAVTGS